MKIVIRSLDKPKRDTDEIIKWFCETFGLVNDLNGNLEIDVMKRFILAAKEGEGLSSKQIAIETPVAHSTVIYHLNRFIDSGLIIKKGRKYYLRAPGMSSLVEEVEYDVEREFRRMLDIASEFDNDLSKPQKNKAKKQKR